MKAAQPKRIDVAPEQVRQIVEQTKTRALTDDEREILEAATETLIWLMAQLQAERLSAKRLQRIIFGPSSEKTDVVFPEPDKSAEDSDEPAQDDEAERDEHGRSGDDKDDGTENLRRKGHGRNPAADYHGAEKICVPHESLKPGEVCPACGKGKLYDLLVPAVVVRVTAGRPLPARVYEMQRLRCNLCGEVFTARAPPDAGKPKYDEQAAAMIALLRYRIGVPHNRLAKLQASLGIPLPSSTQWKVVSEAAPSIFVAFDELARQAAQGDVMYNDDTGMPVLALTGKRRAREAPADDPPDRTGMFTTGIVAQSGGRRIALFFTGRRHAGENLQQVLSRRADQLKAPIQMCDGLARNIPKTSATILANCLSHGRRHVVDVADNFPSECRHVLDTLADIFHNDATARREHMSDDERLAFHQAHSEPVMDELKAWLGAQLEERKVEPNSGFGQAISYLLVRWDKLTLFLRKPGAPLSNNIVERALKRAIIHRKNSLFYRSLYGARVGDAYMSLIYTAELCGADPFDYLVALQLCSDAVRLAPAAWMPWSYREARDRLVAAAA